MSEKIIKCLVVDDEPIAREIMITMLRDIEQVELIGEFGSALETFEYINKHEVDLIFLDINMPGISGISFARSIRKDIQIIFTTAYREYAVEGFELQAVDYLLKPISMDRLSQALQRFVDINKIQLYPEKNKQESVEHIYVRSNRKMIQVKFDSIFYVESYSDYIKIHTATECIITRETISSIESKLPSHLFIRIHRSYIVALKRIQFYTNDYILCNNQELSISRTYRKEVLRRL